MNRVCFDLELEQPNRTNEVTDSQVTESKIIQIGWVIFDDADFTLLSQDSVFVNIGVPLSSFIKKLTKISDEDLAGGTTLELAYKYFAEQVVAHKCSRIPLQWGGGDLMCLREKLGMPVSDPMWRLGRSGLNVKHLYQLYAEIMGLPRSGGVSKVCGRLGLEWLGHGKHNAMIDALNTAHIFNYLYGMMRDSFPKISVVSSVKPVFKTSKEYREFSEDFTNKMLEKRKSKCGQVSSGSVQITTV